MPSVLGHEGCVEIIENRRRTNTSDLSAGDRVTFSIVDSCGNCEFCRNNLNQKCKNLFKVKSTFVIINRRKTFLLILKDEDLTLIV